LHLAPFNLSGYQVCPFASANCASACLNTAGRGGAFRPGGTNAIQEARKRKTRMLFEDKYLFFDMLWCDVKLYVKHCERKNLIFVIRLNGISDILWEREFLVIFADFFNLQFYDYMKILIINRANRLFNYHLTFS
jgi:hypothetical protein